MPKLFYTTGEVSKMLGVSQRTVKNYCDNGKLTCNQAAVTRYRRITNEALERFIKENSLPQDLIKKVTGKKILIVDDDEIFREYLFELLAAHLPDASLQMAVDGYDACIKAGQFIPDLAIIDLKLPKEDGVTVCRRLSENSGIGKIGLIVVTAFPQKEKILELHRLGITCIFEKPLDTSPFLAQVDKLLTVKGNR